MNQKDFCRRVKLWNVNSVEVAESFMYLKIAVIARFYVRNV